MNQFAPTTQFLANSHAAHAERSDIKLSWWEEKCHQGYGRVAALWQARLSSYQAILPLVHQYADGLEKISDKALRERAQKLRLPFRRNGLDDSALVAESFALLREASWRVVSMRHFDSQLTGGRILLAGNVAEMATGEGKTLTAILAAGTAAIAGVPTHVVTANDYLSERDVAEMGPVYRLLGLTVAGVSEKIAHDQRREQYMQDITYCANKDIAFDYLRDCITLGSHGHNMRLQSESLFQSSRSDQLNLRGLHFAIVDEADSVLIDDARTPLIISANRGGDEERQFLNEAYELADELVDGDDYKIDAAFKSVLLSPEGKEKLQKQTAELGPLWLGSIRREEAARQALAVKYFYRRDHDYVVVDGKVQIVDENTGRILPDRSWERGLHQLVEVKEGCELSDQRETLARISYQRFFRRYLRLAGMTGTAQEVKHELWDVYRLRVVPVPTHKPCQRKIMPVIITATEPQHHQRIIDEIQQLQQRGQPVLVGTSSVAESEQISATLAEKNMSHQLLNAKQDAQESQIIAAAGKTASVTVATQMAGRGTDIKLDKKALEQGGLMVLLTMRGEAARVDRQLAGRCARMGNPGSYQEILCIEQLDKRQTDLQKLAGLVKPLMNVSNALGAGFAKLLLRFAQYRGERYHARLRKAVYSQDEQQRDLLAFSGRSE